MYDEITGRDACTTKTKIGHYPRASLRAPIATVRLPAWIGRRDFARRLLCSLLMAPSSTPTVQDRAMPLPMRSASGECSARYRNVGVERSEEHTSELQSPYVISYAP